MAKKAIVAAIAGIRSRKLSYCEMSEYLRLRNAKPDYLFTSDVGLPVEVFAHQPEHCKYEGIDSPDCSAEENDV